ncbi:DUF4435 domain-containing protein [Pantoea stewartii]|nr:DUF4435 domain-containing protein [Pantoea stewartii]
MTSFNDYFSNRQYIQGHSLITAGQVMGMFYVESQNDVGFWKQILDNIHPRKFQIKPASKIKENGKKTLEAEYSKLHSRYLVGVDSDMDYLCPSRSVYSTELNNNPYILHTFSYSKESLQCSMEAIEDTIERLVFDDKIEDEICDALNRTSNIIYEALLIHLYRHNKNPNSHADGLLWGELKLAGNASIISNDLKVDSASLTALQAKMRTFINKYRISVAEQNDFDTYVEQITTKGLDRNTAYQFIKGHVLHDTYVYPALKSFRNKHFTHEKRKIAHECRSDNKRGEREVRFGALDNFYQKNNVLETMLNNNTNYTRCLAYSMIQSKLSLIP